MKSEVVSTICLTEGELRVMATCVPWVVSRSDSAQIPPGDLRTLIGLAKRLTDTYQVRLNDMGVEVGLDQTMAFLQALSVKMDDKWLAFGQTSIWEFLNTLCGLGREEFAAWMAGHEPEDIEVEWQKYTHNTAHYWRCLSAEDGKRMMAFLKDGKTRKMKG